MEPSPSVIVKDGAPSEVLTNVGSLIVTKKSRSVSRPYVPAAGTATLETVGARLLV